MQRLLATADITHIGQEGIDLQFGVMVHVVSLICNYSGAAPRSSLAKSGSK
jgi:hypothetical protein